VLHGRQSEIRALEARLEDARQGRGGAVVVLGEPGIGKTALLDAVAERADGMRAVRTVGLEAESSLPFSALVDLTDGLLDGISALPRPQAEAVEGALALGPSVPGDRFTVCSGFVGLLRHAASQRPVIAIVDDAQWLDPGSAECVAFAARRLDDAPIALVMAARDTEPHPLRDAGLDELRLQGLASEYARAVLATSGPELSDEASDAVLAAAAGNPLALVELPAMLTTEQREGTAPVEEPVKPGDTLRRAFERRVAGLPDATRDALLVTAGSFGAAAGPVLAACEGLGIPGDALSAAEAEGILRRSNGAIEFAHPLIRGAVYHGASPAERRRAHGALAETAAAEHRPWHLAAAALGPDERAAAAVERAASDASGRGAHVAAAEALERAARLSEDRDAATRRLIAAGKAATAGGAHTRAAALFEEAAASRTPDLRGEAIHQLALVTLWETGRAESAHRMLADEAERVEAEDQLRAATVFADAALAASAIGDNHLALATARRAERLLGGGGDPSQRAQVLSILGWSLALRGESDAARTALREVDRLLPEVDPFSPAAQSIGVALNSRIPFEEYERSREECVSIVEGAREAGFLGVVPFPMAVGADAAHRLGDWEAADREAREARRLAEEIGQRGSIPIAMVIRAWVAAGRGDEPGARRAAEDGLAIAESAGLGGMVVFMWAALGLLELGLGRVDRAIEELERVERTVAAQGLDEPTLIPWAPDLVEAYLQAGRVADARRVAETLAAQARRAGGELALALAERCLGLVADDRFGDHFTAAAELHARVPVPFERARTLLAYGARLHRARRRVDARSHLAEALAAFEALGANPWAERARAELEAAGEGRREQAGDPDELTPQELRVALAVAGGATNREVAAELFLSPKTIEFHLGSVYRKLGIHSRTELAALVADRRLEPGGFAEQAASDPPSRR
jgi:DNA-binding CsgD family transcriptional regulator